MATALVVQFAGKTVEVRSALTFGRSGDVDLVLDAANTMLHRCCGTVKREGGTWMLVNTGAHLPLDVRSSGTRIELAPGHATPLPMPSGEVRVRAGTELYLIRYVWSDGRERSSILQGGSFIRGATTGLVDLRESLAPSEIKLVVRYRDAMNSPSGETPSHKQMALVLGLSPGVLTNRIADVRRKADDAGLGYIANVADLMRVLVAHGVTDGEIET